MAVAIIILVALSVFAVGTAMILFMPVLNQFANHNQVWTLPTTDPQAVQVKDILYSAAIAMPIFMAGVIALYAWLSTSRRDLNY